MSLQKTAPKKAPVGECETAQRIFSCIAANFLSSVAAMFRFHLVHRRSKSKVQQGSMYVQSQACSGMHACEWRQGGSGCTSSRLPCELSTNLSLARPCSCRAATEALWSHVRRQCELGRGRAHLNLHAAAVRIELEVEAAALAICHGAPLLRVRSASQSTHQRGGRRTCQNSRLETTQFPTQANSRHA